MIYAGMQTYVEPYAWFIAGAAGIILIETVLIAVLRKKAAYITGLIVSLINIGAFLAVFFILREKFSEIQSALIMISADQAWNSVIFRCSRGLQSMLWRLFYL